MTLVSLRFSEPMDPNSFSPSSTIIVTQNPQLGALGMKDFTLAEVIPSADQREFTFAPTAPGMAHVSGSAEDYTLHVVCDSGHPEHLQDLSGHSPDFADKAIRFQLAPSAATSLVDAFALRFDRPDEDLSRGPEWRGQFKFPNAGKVEGRDVRRFSAVVDANQPVVGLMPTFTLPIKTPLVPLGSRLMSVWRYIDMGFSYPDEEAYNVDVERLWWAPLGGRVSSDFFPRMEILLGHSQFLPDEYITSSYCMQPYPYSGLSRTSFSANVLASTTQLKVYDGPYRINPLEAFVDPGTGLSLMSYPGFADAFGGKITYTWRDTSIASLGAPDGVGCDPKVVSLLGGGWTTYADANMVPTIGLPLLMDFRVHPDSSGLTQGTNGLQVSLASTASSKPNFRVYSSGGRDTSNTVVRVDPNDDLPRGGYNPNSYPPGMLTPADDPVFYWGRCDFVIRLSRGITRWFDTGVEDITRTYPIYLPPLVEPREQPAGTSLSVEFRGANNAWQANSPSQLDDANCVNLYGNPISPRIRPACDQTHGALGGMTPWTQDLASLSGKRYLQLRFSLINNLDTGDVPALSTAGVGWIRNP